MKSRRQFAKRSERKDTKHTLATSKSQAVDIPNGTSWAMRSERVGGGYVVTMDGTEHYVGRWDLIIAHPPCTYLSNVATRSHSLRMTPLEKINERTLKRIEAMQFFMQFCFADCDRIAIENPIGVMNTAYRLPDQTISPYMFASGLDDGENYVTKATCLWLKGLPKLQTVNLKKPNNAEIFGVSPQGKAFTWEERLDRSGGASKARSKTFAGVAEAMAEQWGSIEGKEVYYQDTLF